MMSIPQGQSMPASRIPFGAGRNIKFAVISLFLVNLAAGMIFMNEGLFHYDSVVLAQAVEGTYQAGVLQPAIRGRYGSVAINTVIYFPFFLFGQDADFATRFSSILFHALSIAVLFLFVYELFADYIHAFLSSLLFSFIPFYFSPNTYGKEHGMSIFFMLLSFYLLCRGVRTGSRLITGVSGFLLAFAISIREAVIVACPIYFLLYLSPEISMKPWRIIVPRDRLSLKLLASVLVPFLLFLGAIAYAYFGAEFYKAIFLKNTSTSGWAGLYSPYLRSAMRDLYVSIPKVLFLFFVIGAIRMSNKKPFFLRLCLLLWAALFFYFGNLTSYAPRYLDIVMIPVCIYAAYALATVHAKDRLVANTLALYCALGMLVFMYPMLSFRHGYNGEKQFALYVREKTAANAVIIAMDDAPFIEYYGRRKTMDHPVGDTKKIDGFIRKISRYLKSNMPVYVVKSGYSYDNGLYFKKAIESNFTITAVGNKLSEDYHRPDLRLRKYNQKLLKLDLKT